MDGDVFVGRTRELADFERRLAAAGAGNGALVLVEGGAGAGKTALAYSLVRRARRAGMRAAWGACLEGEGAPAYRPWVQILRELGGSDSLLLDPVGGEAGSRFHVFDDVVALLRAAAEGQGLLLVLDDLHWADVPSMRLLQAVAAAVADSPLLVVGLYRGREAFPYAELAGVLRAVRRERATVHVVLGGLAPPEVAELATRALGRHPGDALVRILQERAEGSPLFVLELVRLVDAAGEVDSGLPDSVREVIGRRLDRLPPAARGLLRRAAVLGRDFTAGMLGALIDEAPDRVFDLLDPAITAELVGADGHMLRFAHVLTRDVLYAELPTAERRRLHARAAEALRVTETEGSVEALAHHLRQAAPIGGADDALQVTREAATRARNQLAYEHAAFQYREALRLLPLVRAGDSLRAELLLDLARCEFRSGAVENAWRSCQAAADVGRATGDAGAVADAATVLRGITNSPVTAQIHAMCGEALALLQGTDPVREAKMLAQLAITADPFADGRDLSLSQRALQIAEATGDPDARFLAMQACHTDLVNGRHVLERLSIGERAIRLAQQTSRDEYAAWGHVWRLDAFWELGRRVQLDAELATFARVIDQLREPLWAWRLTMMQATLALFEGRFEHATMLADRALQIGERGGHDGAGFFHLVLRSHLGLQTGTGLDAVEPHVRRFVEAGPFLARQWHARVLAGMGRLDEASALWDAIVPHLASFPQEAPEWIIAGAGGAELCIALGDRTTAAAVYDALLPYADQQIIAGAHTPCSGPASLYLGMLATLLERWEMAETHLRAALAACKAMGSPSYEAMTHLELARLFGRHRPQDRAGEAHLDRALRIARRLGMAPLTAAAAALRDAKGLAGALSVREEQVAALVAEGLSNRQIAHRLHLSERTAENHVTHILTKLGFDSRARIAAWYAARRRID
jgi:DNA-binding CsgD family transcriptional regulator